MFRYKFTIAYNGKNYYGWQLQPQPNRPTIQGCIESVLTSLTRRRIPLIASSRTDAGVHALGQVAHCTLDEYISTRQLFAHCIQHLPEDISIRKIEYISPTFHARHSLYKCYQYSIWNHRSKPTPLQLPFVWHTPPLDILTIRSAISLLIGTHNYAIFRNYTTNSTPAIRTLFSIYLEQDTEYEEIIRLTFWGNGFLRGMVRNIVGLLVEIGKGKLQYTAITKLLHYTQRKYLPSQTAPPQGLVLHHIAYDNTTVFERVNSL